MASTRFGRVTGSNLVMIATVALALIGLVVPSPSYATDGRTVRYTDTGVDADDVPVDPTSCCVQDPDIRSTTRTVWVDARGRRWLTVHFRTYEAFLGYWSVRIFLDTRGGPRFDASIRIFDSPPHGCFFRRRGSTRREGIVRLSWDHASCRVPLGWTASTKRIRWRLVSRAETYSGNGPEIDEFAPDSGWYR